ncbi:phage tail termination protein [Rosenbergiella collisarenosi]|uniref:phage tail termination protein n=1 Tax=Rosenbergiella collisarenosi TaxID=1544695 RepID=UPI001F4E0E10|nr:hypothetical protein [Rosenbergiella collisarenosi]
MNPPMYKRVRDVLSDAGLTAGYITQSLIWSDTGKITDRFIVFRPNGGSDIDRDIGGEYHILVDIISDKGEAEKSEQTMLSIIDFVKQNPLISNCLGQITNMGGFPPPVMTTEGRIVWRLQFACLYGE